MKSDSTPIDVCVCGTSTPEYRTVAGREGDLEIACCREFGHQWQRNLSRTDHDNFHRQGLQSSQLKINSTGARHARRARIDTLRRVNCVKERSNNDCKLLDWGGAGEFIAAIQTDVAEVVGTELDHERIKFVTERHGLVMTHPSEVRRNFNPGYFDVITLFYVLEHFVNPFEELEQILELLNDGGILIIEVPNLDDWMLSVLHGYRQF